MYLRESMHGDRVAAFGEAVGHLSRNVGGL